VEEWRPESLGITHFDAIDDPQQHLETLRAELGAAAGLARELSADEFERMLRDRIATCEQRTAASFMQALPPEQHWHGLHRYWSKREEKAA
jgi:hypothetical protein